MILVATRAFIHFLFFLPSILECRKISKTTTIRPQNESNLLDQEISSSLFNLLTNFDEFKKEFLNETTTTVSSTTTTTTTFKPVIAKQQICSGFKVTALTNIEFDSPMASIQFWLLKPKVKF